MPKCSNTEILQRDNIISKSPKPNCNWIKTPEYRVRQTCRKTRKIIHRFGFDTFSGHTWNNQNDPKLKFLPIKPPSHEPLFWFIPFHVRVGRSSPMVSGGSLLVCKWPSVRTSLRAHEFWILCQSPLLFNRKVWWGGRGKFGFCFSSHSLTKIGKLPSNIFPRRSASWPRIFSSSPGSRHNIIIGWGNFPSAWEKQIFRSGSETTTTTTNLHLHLRLKRERKHTLCTLHNLLERIIKFCILLLYWCREREREREIAAPEKLKEVGGKWIACIFVSGVGEVNVHGWGGGG